MSAEYQILSAFRTWRDVARTKYSAESLPNDEALIAAAESPELLKSGSEYPELLIWAKPLRRVIGYARVGTTTIIEDGSDTSLFEPDLTATIEAKDDQEPAQAAPRHQSQHSVDNASKSTLLDVGSVFEKVGEPSASRSATGGGRRRRSRSEHSSAQDSNLRAWEAHEFSRLDAFSTPQPMSGAGIRVSPNTVGGLDLDWELPSTSDGNIRLFRIVSDEQAFEVDPDFGEHRAVTVGTHWVDNEPLTTAYRMYQIWMYEGSSESSAVQSEPVFIGERSYINPIEAIELSVAGSEVKGQWISAEHTHRVAIYAVPVSERLALARRNEIATETPNLQGFRFEPHNRGREYKFVAQRFVSINGFEQASAPSDEFNIHVPAEVVEVPISVEELESSFRVSWMPPHSGEVLIYRTQEAPEAELQFNEIEVDQLEGFGLARRDWANDLEGEKSSCEVTWPDDWYSIFITPVNVVGNQAQVGKTFSRVRVGEISNATLHERVNSQLLTFGWPEEAHEVTAVFGELGTGPNIGPTADTPGTSLVSIHQAAYQEEGGMRFPLPGPGDIALFASRVYGGSQIWGKPVILTYPGVRKFRYQLKSHSGRLFLAIFTDREDAYFDQFTLRIHGSRLPLEPEDGDEVLTRAVDGATKQLDEPQFSPGISAATLGPENREVLKYWEIDPQILQYPPTSYLRLFIRQPENDADPVNALIDPHPSQMLLKTWIGG